MPTNNKKNKSTKTKHGSVTMKGLSELFVLISAGYCVYLVTIGTDGIAPKVMTIPLALWLVCKVVKRFTT